MDVGVGGTEVGGAVCTFGAGGGVNGILLGLIAESEEGAAGDVGLLPGDSTTPPGGGGMFDFASELCDPGRKAGSELLMLSFVAAKVEVFAKLLR